MDDILWNRLDLENIRDALDRLGVPAETPKRGKLTVFGRLYLHLDNLKAQHDRRVTELLAANNAEVERRRAAERRVELLEAARGSETQETVTAWCDERFPALPDPKAELHLRAARILD